MNVVTFVSGSALPWAIFTASRISWTSSVKRGACSRYGSRISAAPAISPAASAASSLQPASRLPRGAPRATERGPGASERDTDGAVIGDHSIEGKTGGESRYTDAHGHRL